MALQRIIFFRGGKEVNRQFAPSKTAAKTMCDQWRQPEPFQRGFLRQQIDTPTKTSEWLNLMNQELRATKEAAAD